MTQLDSTVNEFVNYEIYIFPTDKEQRSDDINAETYAKTIAGYVCDYASDLSKDYFWYIDGFNLSLSKFSQGDNIFVLKGKTVFGDCLDDEWFVTFLLFRISQKFPQVIIRTWDFDGEFLLIEAAEYLPDWLEPETSSNRVFIHSGNILIINQKDLNKPNILNALDFVRIRSDEAVASAEIQKCIRERIIEFENGQKLHFARIILPRKLAIALQTNPKIITSIIRAFIHRDLSDMNKISSLIKIKSESGLLDFVPVKVSFTRMQFAQLLCQTVEPPKNYPVHPKNSEEYIASFTGLKLALGAELYILDGENSKCTLSELLKLQGDIVEYNGPDGDYSWMELDDGIVMNDIEDRMKSFQLNKDEEDSVVEAMLREEEGSGDDVSDNDTPILRKLNHFLKSSSGFEGVDLNYPSHSNSDHEDMSLSTESDESNEDTLEREIMEAIMFDPDLMMKILERGEILGLDTGDLLEKMKESKKNVLYADKPTVRQKGLADIDESKLSAARMSSRKHKHSINDIIKPSSSKLKANANVNNEELSSLDEDCDIYDEINRPSSKTSIEESQSDSVSESDIHDMKAYLSSMDLELQHLDIDRQSGLKDENMQEALKNGCGPAHTIYTSLK